MRVILLLSLCCAALFGGNEYGRPISLKRIPGVDEGAMSAALYRNTLWIAGAKGSLFAFDVSRPEFPKMIRKLRVLKSCRQLAIYNGIAAVVGRQHGMALVDVREPDAPRVLSRYPSIELATGIDLTEKYAYIGNRIYGVETVDISDPSRPRFLGNLLTDEAQSVKACGNKVFVGDWAAGRIQIADASNPARLKALGSIRLDGYGDGLDVQGNLVFASTGHHRKSGPAAERPGGGHGMEIWNIENPVRPRRLSIFRFPRFYNLGNDYWTVRVSGSYAFCADTHNGFFVLDIADPEKPVCIGNARLEEIVEPRRYDSDGKLLRNSLLADAVSGLAIGEGVVYLTGLKTGLYLAELPGIAVPRKPERFPENEAVPEKLPALAGYAAYRTAGMVREAEVVGDVAFLAASDDGIHSVRLGDRKIERLRHYPQKSAFDLKIRGEFLYVAENADGIGVYKIRENGILEPAARIPMPWGQDCQRIWAPENTGFIVVSDHGGWIFFLDVSDPQKAKVVFRHSQVGIVYSDLMTHQLVGGRYLFFNWHHSGYTWYDMAGKVPVPANRKRVRFANHRGGALSLGARCLAVADGGYYLLEANQEGDPSGWKLIRVPGKTLIGVPSADGDTVVLSYRRTGEITVLDIRDPLKPVWNRTRSLVVPGMPGAVRFFRHRMVIPAGYAGLYLELSPGVSGTRKNSGGGTAPEINRSIETEMEKK